MSSYLKIIINMASYIEYRDETIQAFDGVMNVDCFLLWFCKVFGSKQLFYYGWVNEFILCQDSEIILFDDLHFSELKFRVDYCALK